jgi:hypothetical protein
MSPKWILSKNPKFTQMIRILSAPRLKSCMTFVSTYVEADLEKANVVGSGNSSVPSSVFVKVLLDNVRPITIHVIGNNIKQISK